MVSVKALGKFKRDQIGSLTVDFALIATPLVLLIFGTMATGQMLWYQNALNYSVEEAARCASIDANNCSSVTQIKSYAAGRSGAGFAPTVFDASTPSCGNKVTATYAMPLYIPFAPISVTLTAQSCYPK
jgi:TadE-like protein